MNRDLNLFIPILPGKLDGMRAAGRDVRSTLNKASQPDSQVVKSREELVGWLMALPVIQPYYSPLHCCRACQALFSPFIAYASDVGMI